MMARVILEFFAWIMSSIVECVFVSAAKWLVAPIFPSRSKYRK